MSRGFSFPYRKEMRFVPWRKFDRKKNARAENAFSKQKKSARTKNGIFLNRKSPPGEKTTFF